MSNFTLDYEEKKEHDETPQSQDAHIVTTSAMNLDSPASILATDASSHDDDDTSDTHSISGQRNTMSARQLRIAIPTLSVCLFVSFIDQTSVSTATPAIAGDLNTGTATSWIGTSFLIASTAFQLINGRLSDIFGRKGLLLVCLFLLAMGDLGCGFAQTAEQLFVLRAIAGIGGGGINSLVMIIVSDITTLQNRGKYQGRSNRALLCDNDVTHINFQAGSVLSLLSVMVSAHSSGALSLKAGRGDGCSG
jgi:Na+/melibiose symporter-like transporter